MKDFSKIRVLEVAPAACGGMKQHYLDLLAGLKDRGIEVFAVCDFGEDETKRLQQAGISVLRFKLSGSVGPFQYFLMAIKLARMIKLHNIDVVHCHGFKAALVGRMASRLAGCPCVYTVHNFVLCGIKSVWKRKMFRFIECLLARHTDRIITVSQALKKHMVEIGITPAKVHVVYNGIDLVLSDKGRDVRKMWNVSEECVVVGTVARLIPSKGIDFLLDAAAAIVKEFNKIRFMIVGSGPDEERLRKKARDLNITNEVIFTGYVKNIRDYYDAFDIFVLPTLCEGFGISVLQAMAAKKIVIATEVGGIPEIIRHRFNGYLIAPGNSAEIARSVIYFARNPLVRREYGERGYRCVVKNFSLEMMIDETVREIKNVLRKG